MKSSGTSMRRSVAGVGGSCLLGAAVLAIVVAPVASAADCSAGAISGTVSSVTGQAQQYLNAHPDANQVVTAAYGQPRGQASADLRAYFTAHPAQYYDLRGILAPIGDTQNQCGVTVLPPELASAYSEFMAG
jgi:heme-binding protein